MMVNAKLDFSEAFLADLAFYPGDIIKNVLAVTSRWPCTGPSRTCCVRRVKRVMQAAFRQRPGR